MPDAVYLTTAEIASKFTVPDRDCVDCWQRLLCDFRQSRRLKNNGADYRQRKMGRRYVREYNEVAVLRALWDFPHPFAEAVQGAYHDLIPRIVKAAQSSAPPTEPNQPN